MLWWGDEKAFAELNKEQLVQAARLHGLYIKNIHVPFTDANDNWSADDEIRDGITGKSREWWFADCSRYRIPMMVMDVSRGDAVDRPNEYGLNCMNALLRYAEQTDVKIALENSRRNILLAYLLDNIDSGHLGLCYDTSHGALYGDRDFRLLEKYGARVMCFHVSYKVANRNL